MKINRKEVKKNDSVFLYWEYAISTDGKRFVNCEVLWPKMLFESIFMIPNVTLCVVVIVLELLCSCSFFKKTNNVVSFQ